MSGVEIAGFVLASLPLMISALEHYRETAEVLEGWWKIKCEYRKCMRNLKYHKVSFEENLEELLLPLIADEKTLEGLLKNPGGPEWQDQELESMLKARMPKTYENYLDTIEMLKEVIESLDEALGMNKVHFQGRVTEQYHIEKTPSGTRAAIAHVTSVSVANIEFHSQRIKLAFNKGVRQQLFEDFGDHNNRLRDILGSSDRLAILRKSRVSNKTSAANAALWKFWNHGNSLFNLLTEAWSCQCQALHHANLLLQHRQAPTVNFRVIFWFRTHLENVHSVPPWSTATTSIKLVDDVERNAKPITLIVPPVMTPAIQITPQPQPKPQPPGPTSPQMPVAVNTPKLSRRSMFMDKFRHSKQPSPTKSSIPVPSAPSPSILPVPAPDVAPPVASPAVLKAKTKVSFAVTLADPVDDPANPRITNFCTTITTCSIDHPYGCLKGDTCQYLVQPLSKADIQPQTCITLEDLLSKSSTIDISRSQRFQIALILASSHIQLHPTPWLKSRWSKKDILFLHDDQDPTKIFTDQPYISQSISRGIQQNNKTANTTSISSTYTFQDSIRNLGIMLLELCFGYAIEDHKMRRSLNAEDEQSLQLINYAVAIQWARDVVGEAGPEFSDAVTWCLHHTPESTGIDGLGDRWREDMFAKVVEPLKYCHDQLVAVRGTA